MVGQTCMPVYPTFLIFEKLGLACTNLASQPYICLCFPCHEGMCLMAAGQVHDMQLQTFIHLSDIVLCSLGPHWQTVMTESTFRAIPLGTH